MRADSRERFLSTLSTIIKSGQARKRVVESPSRLTSDERKLSSTLMKNLTTFNVDKSAQELMRVHGSFRPNKSESFSSHQL